MPIATCDALTDPDGRNTPGGGGQAYNSWTDRTKIELPELGDPSASGVILDTTDAYPFKHNSLNFKNSQTASGIWTPGAGKSFAITDIVVNAAAAGYIDIYDTTNRDSSRVAKLAMSANQIFDHAYRKAFIGASGNSVLRYDTSAGISGSLVVSGYEV